MNKDTRKRLRAVMWESSDAEEIALAFKALHGDEEALAELVQMGAL